MAERERTKRGGGRVHPERASVKQRGEAQGSSPERVGADPAEDAREEDGWSQPESSTQKQGRPEPD